MSKQFTDEERKVIREKYIAYKELEAELTSLITGKRSHWDAPPGGLIDFEPPGGGRYLDPPGICTE